MGPGSGYRCAASNSWTFPLIELTFQESFEWILPIIFQQMLGSYQLQLGLVLLGVFIACMELLIPLPLRTCLVEKLVPTFPAWNVHSSFIIPYFYACLFLMCVCLFLICV